MIEPRRLGFSSFFRLLALLLGGVGFAGIVACCIAPYSGRAPAGYAGERRVSLLPDLGGRVTERYARRDDTPFLSARDNPVSTFSVDVDTASYSNVRRFLTEGVLPPPDAVRVEELVNYFRYAPPPPVEEGAPLGLGVEVGPCPWNDDHRLARIALAAASLPPGTTVPRRLTFLIDVSGSMNDEHKLPLVKAGLSLLAERLGPADSVAIVVYAGAEGVALPPTPGTDRRRILRAIEHLDAGGATNGAAGITLAYQVARDMYAPGAVNRVILATDGDFNVGASSPAELVRLIDRQRRTGVFLTVLGFGMGNLKDDTLEALADHGDGNYAYVDSLPEARKVLVDDAAATLVTVAKDVKIEVELDPRKVAAYRLVGYENRRLSHEDFADDAVDAGDMGAGQTVTALYELVPARDRDSEGDTADDDRAGLFTVSVRWKPHDGRASRLFRRVALDDGRPLDGTTPDFRFAAAVASFGLVLGQSPFREGATLSRARALAASALEPDTGGRRREFLALVDGAARLEEKRSSREP